MPYRDLEAYFRENVLLYVPYYSYDDKRIAVESNDRGYMGSLKRAYKTFTEWLMRSEPPGNRSPAVQTRLLLSTSNNAQQALRRFPPLSASGQTLNGGRSIKYDEAV